MAEIREQIAIVRELGRMPNVVDDSVRIRHCDHIADTMEKMLAVVEAADTVSRSNGMSLYALQNLHKALADLVLEGTSQNE